MPEPATGGLPGDAGRLAPLKMTLLSCTCNMAFGEFVLIPILPWADIRTTQNSSKTIPTDAIFMILSFEG
jgi:hypothetical protein